MSKLVALHTAAVAVGDNQTKNEVAYGDYSRTALPKDGLVQFPVCTDGAEQYCTHASVAEEDGEIIEVIELTPASMTQIGAGPCFNASDFA